MSLSSIRAAIATALIPTGVRASAVWPRQINYPAAIVVPESGMFYANGSASPSLEFTLILLVGPASDSYDRLQTLLDGYLDLTGPRSIKAAIEEDRSLGGTVQDVIVTGWDEYGEIDANGVTCIGCRFSISVQA